MTSTQVSTPSTAASYTLEDWRGGYRSLPQEYDYWIDDIEGEIPTDLHGTLFRNGPGLFELGGDRYRHPFDGDGMVCAIAFRQGRAHFRNRFVRTEEYVSEQQVQKILYRGVFGTQKPGGWMSNAFDFRLKNIANTNILPWGDKLLALWEAAEPYRLDPWTLETLGKDNLYGGLQPGEAFAAHPRIDPACAMDGGEPCLVNFSLKPGLSTTLTIFELNPQGTVVRRHAHAIPGFAFIHDFAITPNYCIFFQNPVAFNPIPFVLGLRGAGECITFQPSQPTQIILIPRHGSAPVQMLPTRAGFIFHHANAFEQDGKVIVDSICYSELSAVDPDLDYLNVDFDRLAPGQLWRFTLDPIAQTVAPEVLASRCCEFPTLHPSHQGRAYRYLYLGAAHAPLGNAPLQGILKLDLEQGEQQFWSDAPRGFAGEPIFVPRPQAQREDDGWLLSLFFNAATGRSEVLIHNATHIEHGPIARLRLQHHVPYGLHGHFTPTCFAPSVGNTL